MSAKCLEIQHGAAVALCCLELSPVRTAAKLGPKGAFQDFQAPDLPVSAILNNAVTYTHIYTKANK